MSFSLIHDVDSKRAVLRFLFPTNIAEYVDAREQVIDLCSHYDIHDVLVDLSRLNSYSDISQQELLNFAKSWDNTLAKNLRFALVLPSNLEAQKEFFFIAYVSKQEGISIRTFNNSVAAIQWLKVTSTQHNYKACVLKC